MVCTFFRFAVYTDARSIAVTACNRLIIAAAGKRTSQRNTRSLARTVYRALFTQPVNSVYVRSACPAQIPAALVPVTAALLLQELNSTPLCTKLPTSPPTEPRPLTEAPLLQLVKNA